MRNGCALLLTLAAALAADAADDPQAAGGPAPAARLGEAYGQVIAERGRPASEMAAGSVRILYYPDATLKLRDNVVVEVKASASSASAPPASPAAADAAPGAMVFSKDPVELEIDGFEKIVLGRLEGGRFGELEALSAHIIKERSLFADGSWKILRFHEALEAPGGADENWSAREAEIVKWEAQFPASITARTVHIGFLAAYARRVWDPASAAAAKGIAGSAYAERLTQAAGLYQSARSFDEKSPMLWLEGQKVALLQGWPAKDVLADFYEAKRAEPGFWHYDGQVAVFLLPKWYGKDGDWERLAEAEIQRGDGLGVEGYARTVFEMSGQYKNIFKESRAGWALVKEGYGVMVQGYPASRMLLNQFALLAVLAEDRPEAREAFKAMKGEADPFVWRTRSASEFQEWAGRGP